MEDLLLTPLSHQSRIRSFVAALLALGLLLAPVSAQATPSTLKRSVSNMLMAPLDLVTGPAVAVRIIDNGYKTQDDSTLSKVVWTVPGFLFLCLLETGGSVMREVSGVLELVPGAVLLFSKSDLRPLYAPTENGAAFVDFDAKVLRLKFGIDYTNTIK